MIARVAVFLAAVFLTAFTIPSLQAETMTPPEIWEGYDPRAEPLDEEILKSWEEDGVSYKEVYFNGEQFDGKYVRIYGIYAAPTGAKNLPALLHIHGGGQTVNRNWLKELTGRGYAVMTFNWGGEWPKRKPVTLWNDVPNGDHRKRYGQRVTEPTPRADAYFLWTQASMRCVTYLENQPEVDADKIGAFGISMGGTIMWNIAFDPRIKAGCAIYGAGWNTYAQHDPKYAIGHPVHEPNANDLRWRESLAPEASAPYVQFPMLFLSSSNDRHGYMDRAEDSLKLIPEGVPRAWALSPRFRHHIDADFIHTLPLWMDVHLKGEGVWPENPPATIKTGPEGVPVFHLKPDQPENVVKVEVFYALEKPYAVNRHWRSAPVEQSGDLYSSVTPVMDAKEYLYAYANITYKSGAVFSSALQAVIPEEIGGVATIQVPSRVFYDGAEGVGDWTSNSTGTDPIPSTAAKHLKGAIGPEGKPGLSVGRVSPLNYAPGDPEYRAPKGASLQFDIKTEAGEQFVVKLHQQYWVLGFRTYACDVSVDAGRGWQTVTLSGADFKDEKSGELLGEDMHRIEVLELVRPKSAGWKDAEVMFRNFRWLGGEYVPHVHAYRQGATKASGRAAFSSDDAAHLLEHEASTDEPIVMNATFNSENEYKVVPGGFRKGAQFWTDRTYRAENAPTELLGADIIQTPMVDRANRNDALITFTVAKDCAVYVGLKDAEGRLPGWLSGWSVTDTRLSATNSLLLYRKNFKAGEQVVLESISGSGISAMYSVLVVASEGASSSKNLLEANDTLVFFGDSITQLGARPGGYVSLVSETLANNASEMNIQVVGAGVGGNKVPDLLRRVERDVLRKQPDLVMIYIGINDVWHWTKPHPVTKEPREGTSAEVYESGLRSLISQIQAVGADVVLCTPTVIGEQTGGVNPDDARLDQYAAICREVAQDTGSTLLDLRKVFVDYLSTHNTKNVKRGVLTADSVHMNDVGNRLLAQQVCERLGIPFQQEPEASTHVMMQNKEKLHLYLLIGQSNMAGRARIPEDATGDIENCFLLNDQGEWTPASNPLNRYSSARKDLEMQKLGPGYSFSKAMLKQNPDVALGLVVNARGGSRIESWERGAPYYEGAVGRMKVAQQSGTLKGVLWHQGESNETDADYLPKLEQLIANLREDLGNPNLPFVVGQINGIQLINDQLAALPDQVANTACVSSEGLTTQDRWHFDTASQFKIGERYAEAMLQLSNL